MSDMNMNKVYGGFLLFVSGYCFIKQLILLRQALIELRKIRRKLNNSYMNMITSIEENKLDDIA